MMKVRLKEPRFVRFGIRNVSILVGWRIGSGLLLLMEMRGMRECFGRLIKRHWMQLFRDNDIDQDYCRKSLTCLNIIPRCIHHP